MFHMCIAASPFLSCAQSMTCFRNGLLVFDSLDRGGKLSYFNLLFDVIRFASIGLAIDVNVYCLDALFWTCLFCVCLAG